MNDLSNFDKRAIFIATIIAIIFMFGGTFYMMSKQETPDKTSDNKKITETKSSTESAIEVKDTGKTNNEAKPIEKTPAKPPIPVEDWEMKSHTEMNESDKESLYKKFNKKGLSNFTDYNLPKEENGFTNDVKKRFFEDGFPNGLFVYHTNKSVHRDISEITERIINPVFGEWGQNVGMSSFQIENAYKGIATKEYVTKVIAGDTAQAFYVDNEIGEAYDINSTYQHMGKVNSMDVKQDPKTGKISMKLIVTYYNLRGEKIVKRDVDIYFATDEENAKLVIDNVVDNTNYSN